MQPRRRAADDRLRHIPCPEIKASILADDVGGGWTNGHTIETMVRFPGWGALKRPFPTALVWTSETASALVLEQEAVAAIYGVAFSTASITAT